MKQNGSHCLHFARTLVSFGKQNVAISYFILLSAPLTDQCLSNADFSSGHVQKDSATLSSRSALSHISLVTDSKDVLTSQPMKQSHLIIGCDCFIFCPFACFFS